jgi:uncharacterized protein (DUF2147 family)
VSNDYIKRVSCPRIPEDHVMRRLVLAFALFAAGLSPAVAGGIEGRWIPASGNVIVEVAPCGEALCGTIVEILSNMSMSEIGKELPADVPGVGTQVLIGLEPSGEGEWQGQIFNRENGKTYNCNVGLPSSDKMTVHGYVGIPLFGKTQVWERAPMTAF